MTRLYMRPSFVVSYLLMACVLLACGRGSRHTNRVESEAIGLTAAMHSNDISLFGKPCETPTVDFALRVWNPVLKADCAFCHMAGGYAQQAGSKFVLIDSRNPDYLTANRQLVKDFGAAVLAKTSGQVTHGGGTRFAPDSAEFIAMREAMQVSGNEEACELDFDRSRLSPEQGYLEQLSAPALLRKVALQLAGRLPTAAERAQVEAGGEDALAQVLDRLTREEAFYDWLGLAYNEVLLTDKFLGWGGPFIDGFHFPNYQYYTRWPDGTPERALAYHGTYYGIGREALELVKYVVRHDKPFTEVVTADYMMVNPMSAPAYLGDNHQLRFANPQDPYEFVPARLADARGHAGLLNSPTVLQRFSTTDSNRNRLRAKTIYKIFLDTDIMQLKPSASVDPSTQKDPQEPVQQDVNCIGCHRILDPVAGLYQNYLPTGVFFKRTEPWHKNMAAPGFEGKAIPAAELGRASQWLGQEIAKDPRFVRATTHRLLQALTGKAPLAEPDPAAADYLSQLRAYRLQRQLLTNMGEVFVKEGYQLRSLVRELVLSPYYRASGIANDAPSSAETVLASFGTARRRTPEDLHKILKSLTGQTWREYGLPVLLRGPTNWFEFGKPISVSGLYNLLLGGIDSDAVTERTTGANAVIVRASNQLARKVACESVVHDLMLPAAKRTLLPYTEAGVSADDPRAEPKLRQSIAYLHGLLLGDDLPPDHAEVTASYELLRQVFDLYKQKPQQAALPWYCLISTFDEQGRGPNNTRGEALAKLPTSPTPDSGEARMMRAWIAVVTVLLADYRFLYD